MKVRKLKNCTKIDLQGELTIYQAKEMGEALKKHITEGKAIEINLQDITELDTSGIQILLVAKRESERLEKKLTMVQHSNAVVEVIDLLNIAHEFGDPIVISNSKT